MIENYSFGKIIINDIGYKSDIKIITGNVIAGWWRKEGHSICKEDVEDILAENPEIFILGTGSYGTLKVPEDFSELMNSLNIKFIAEKTGEATELYNKLYKEKKVCFAAHLSC